MQQLSGLDNVFLNMEDSRLHMHVASLGIYDPSSAPGGHVRFKTVLDFFSAKINEIPFFRRRLVGMPFGLDRPYFMDDPNIDVEYHVRHIALPDPGDWRQLMIQVARLHSRPLDLTRPLWEAYVIGRLDNIEGIPKGSFALYIKLHHCAIDGQAGAQMMGMLHSLTPESEASPKTNVIYADHEPSPWELGARSFANRGRQVLDASRLALQLGKKTVDMGAKYGPGILSDLRSGVRESVGLKRKEKVARSAHQTRFDGKVSPHRVVDALGVSIEDCNSIRGNIKCTINDIFLTVSGGALRKYLKAHHDLPGKGLNAMMPLAATGDQINQNSANNVSMTVVPMYTDIADPIERLVEVKKSAGKSKEVQDDLGRDLVARLMDVLPSRLTIKGLESAILKNSSCTVSNVRGPDVPLYIAGAQMEMFLPVSIPFDGAGLNITGFSYHGTLWVCIAACREMMPDPGFFTECFREALDDLVAASEEYASRSKVETHSAPIVTNISGRAKKAPAKKAKPKPPAAKKAVRKKAPVKRAAPGKTRSKK